MRIFDADVTGSLQVSGSSNFKGGVTVSGSQTVTGSLTVHGDAKIGDQLTDTHTITGSLNVTGSISGSLTGTLRADYIDLNTNAVVPGAIGRMTWNDADGTVDIGMKGGNVTLQVGQEQLIRVVNKSGVDLSQSNYQAVRVIGAIGNRISINLSQANNDANSAETIGLVTETMINNAEGFVTTSGLVRGINTTGALQGELWSEGDILYLSPTILGRLTNVKPTAPEHLVIIGYVIRSHATVGSIYVKVNNGYELDELHDIKINTGSLTYGDLLMRSGSVWTNSKTLSGSYQLTGSLDISGSQTINGSQIISGSLTITNNITVLGTSSFVYVTSSNLNLTGPFIYTNIFEPIERFGGLVVFDSGSDSHLATASLLWDSLNNHWIYQNASGSMYSGGMLLSGPRNTGSLGNEIGLTSTRIPKSVGGDHLDNSNIYDDGSKVKVISNTEITGSLKVTGGISGSIDYSYIQNVPSLVSGSSQINITGTTGYNIVSGSIAAALSGSWRASDGISSDDISFGETVTIQGGANALVTFLPGSNTFVINSSHQSVSAAGSSNNSGRTYIQDILLDSFGHITGITTATETVVNTDFYTTGATFNTGDGVLSFNRNDGGTYTVDLDGRYGTSSTDYYVTGGTFNTGTGNLRLTRNDGGTIDVNLEGRYLTAHPSVSAASSSDNSGRTYIQDILLDSFGHITGITTATETVVDTYTTGGTTNSTTGLITFTKSDGGTYTTSISGYVSTQIANLVDSAPTTLDTLNELAAALGDDPNFATTIATAIGNKVSKSGDTMTGNLTAPKFITSGGTSSQFVKGDGTLDGNTYLTSFSETDTLATVTARGSSTATPVTFNSDVTLGNAADLKFVDLAGTFPTSGKGFDWTLNNDGARIYAIQPSSDSIDLVFQLRDNATTNDRFVFWVDDYQGPAFDKYPLIIRGGTEFDLYNSALYVAGTLVLSNGRVLQNVTGNISMFTNDSGYLTAHPSVTAAGSSNNSGRTYIQDILLDSFGHITGITTATETVVDTNNFINNVVLLGTTLRFTGTGGAFSGDIDLTAFLDNTNYYVTGGTFNTGTGNLRLTRNDGGTIDVSLDGRYLTAHPSVSAASSSNNSGRTYIQDILLDSFGHITGITTATETVTDTFTTGATFNTGDGVITFTNNNGGGTFTVDIDGRYQAAGSYLTAESDTLDSVAQRGATTTTSLTAVSFRTTGGNSSQFVKGDGSLDGNTYLTAHPSVTASSSSNNSGRTYIQDILLDSFGHITGITTATETVVDTDTNYYTTGATFNTGNGNVTFTRNDGGTYTVNLDGRYQAAGSYLTSESDTLATVTARGASTSTAVTLSSSGNHFNGHHYFDAYDTNGNHYPHYNPGSSNNGSKLNLRMFDSSGNVVSFYLNGATQEISWAGNTIWHSGNDGSSSGLDADLLDGQHGSYYYPASNPSGYISSYLNYYTTGATFNTSNGVITFSRNDGNTYTVDIDGKYAESVHTHDDRYLPYAKTSDVNRVAGWYTIAANPGNRAVGRFILRDTSSGNHQSVVFYATHHYGNYSDITVLINSRYSGNPFRTLRIVDGSTYDGALLQVYIDDSSCQVQAWMLENIQNQGWVIKDWVADGVDPGDINNFPALTEVPAQVDLDQAPQGGIITTGPIYGGGDTTQYEYLNTNNYSTTTDTRYYTETEIANFFAGSSAITGYNKSNWDTAYGWGNHSTQGYATTGYVQTQITNLVDGAPGLLDTLNELAAAIGDDANFATTITTSIGNKVSKSGDTMTGNLNFGATSNLGLTWGLNSDGAFIKFISTSDSTGGSYLEIGTSDNSDEEIKFTQSGNVRFYLATDGYLRTGGYKYVYETGTWGIDISGNAATVTNGVYTNGSYSNPSWITALAGSKITGNISGNAYNITQYTINQDLGTSNSPSFNNVTATGVYGTNTSSSRNKYNVYGNSGTYAIGMEAGNNFGGLADWAMTFQMNNDDDRGFWWGDDNHNTSQGAMALTTNGYLTVARGVRVGYGESDTATPNVPLQVYGSGSLVFDVQGSQGQLFSVTDSLSGSLFSVNDISGLPILEVFSDDRLVAGSYGTNAFVVSGTTTTVSGSLAVSGSATVNGGTVWHSGNDGSGSGLDADTLDGYHASSFLTSYTETDTLASVTARGASTSTQSVFTGGLNARKNQTDNNYTTAALTTESFGNTTTGVAFHISGVVGKFLEMRTDGVLYWDNSKVWTAGTDGSGSGLDADTLDGYHASSFLTAHPSVSAASSSDNSGRTYIQDILLDSFGHITGITTATETVVDTDTNYYVTSAAFNSGNGNLTLTRNDGGTVTANLDGRYLTSFSETDTLNSVTTRGASTTNNITIGGLTVGGSLTYGSYTSASNYVTGADNILLKGNSTGVSGIFFESEKDGTNINHPSDFGFIQYHAYGIGGSSGEANRLVIGVSNDADDLLVLNPVSSNGLVVRVGAGTTEYTVYHAGNIPTWNQNTSGNAATATLASTVTINYNNDSNSNYQMLWGSGNSVYGTAGVYLNPSSDYVYGASFNASDWFRSSAATGWYNSTYGGGIYQTESTMVRVYDNRGFWIDGGNTNTVQDATLYVTATNNNDWLAQFNAYNSSKSEYGIYVNIAAGATYGYALRTDSSSFTYRVDGSGRVYAPIYYDINDTAYYLNPASTSNLATVKLNSTASGTEVFTIDGVNGRLFTITDDLSNSLFSVNTIAGVPVIEVFADNKVVMGRYNQNDFYIATTGEIGMGNTSVSGYKLAVTGNIRATAFVKTGGSSSQFLMADGSVSTNPGWITSFSETDTLDSVLARGNTTTRTAEFYQTSNTFINTVAAANRGLTVYQDTAGADAYMTFHISGDYAGYFGLGGAENDLVWGGWSLGNVRNRIWHSGNDGSGSGLDADTLDGQHASAFLTGHPSVSAAGSSNNSGRTYIQDILLDSFGHITGITTATETVVDTDTNYYVTSASFNTSNGIITLTRNDGGTVTVDIDGKYAESSHTHDDRYFTETESDARFHPLENQRVSTSSTVRFSNTYTTAWFRNDNSNTGLYNESTTQHLSSNTNGYWDMSSTTSVSSIRFYTGGHVSAIRGYVYANTSNEIGFLNSGGNWGLRMDNNYNVQVYGELTANNAVRSPIYFDSADSNYYLNPNGYSNLGTVRFNSSGANAEVVAVDGVNGRLFTVTDDMTDSIFSVNTISGLPVIEAFADYTVVMGRFGQNDLKINGSDGAVTIRGNTVWHAGNDGASSGLDADLLDGQHGSYYAAASSLGSYLPLGGGTMTGTITITNTDIRSNATSNWTGDPGTQGKIQYHANRWYIVSDSSSDRIVQFRRNGTDVSYIDNSGNFIGNASTASALTSMNISQFTNNSGYITSYSETDTLASVTARGASTSTAITLSGGSGTTPTLSLDRNIASPSNYYNGVQLEVKATSGTAGIGLHRNGFSHVGIYHDSTNVLKFDMNSGTVTLNHNTGTVWGTGNLTNLNQLTNGPGYITSYSETDTLASVTARGASTSTAISMSGGLTVSRDLYINGGTGGGFGNRLIVGGTSAPYTMEDGNNRPVIYSTGQYPVITLNHTVTSNTSHGPTIQLTHNTLDRQWVIGSNGTGTQLDFGYSTNTNRNPHNGIDNLNGTTYLRITNGGNMSVASNLLPWANNTYNLGSASLGWANVYTNDLHLSNMNKPEGNDIDGTSGTWTIQEGAENLYIINNLNGKKYRITLEEI